jgi:hypothetical protein
MAPRSLEDRAALCRRSEAPARIRGHDRTAQRYQPEAAEAEDAAHIMRRALEDAQRGTRAVEDPETEHDGRDARFSDEAGKARPDQQGSRGRC